LRSYENKQEIAVEIETGQSDTLGNIRKCLDSGFDKIVVVAVEKSTKERIEKKVKKAGMDMQRVSIVVPL